MPVTAMGCRPTETDLCAMSPAALVTVRVKVVGAEMAAVG